MSNNELIATIEDLVIPGKGILAADESIGTIGKRFAAIQLENNVDNRREYRSLLCTTPNLEQYISGVILFEETLSQQDNNGTLLPDVLRQKGIVPGVKVDKGLITLANTNNEKITQGLDGLSERLQAYKEQGAQFAKWRNVYAISDSTPSVAITKAGAEILARYAAVCQDVGIVPIVEPEVLIDGDHAIDHCSDVCEIVLHELFKALFIHQVQLEYMILKPSMILAGKDCAEQWNAAEIAEYTISVFRNHVPAAVPSINFLSGGQTPEQATVNLNAINAEGDQPWQLSFSYGRALQEPCLQAWQGNIENINKAQSALLNRAKLNAAATLGEYTE